MPFLDWVNKSQATRTAQNVPYHLLRQVSAHGVVDGRYSHSELNQGILISIFSDLFNSVNSSNIHPLLLRTNTTRRHI